MNKPIPPSDVDAELFLLAGLLDNLEVWMEISSDLQPFHFYTKVNAQIYEAACVIHETGVEPTNQAIRWALETNKFTSDVDAAMEWVHNIRENYAVYKGSDTARYHADIIKDKWLGRHFIESMAGFKRDIMDGANVAETILKVESFLRKTDVTKQNQEGSPILKGTYEVRQYIRERIENKGKLLGIPTGLSGLDYMTDGYQNGEYILVGARTSQGKSAFMMQSALAASHAGYEVGVVSIEMSMMNQTLRAMCMKTGISLSTIRKGEVSEETFKYIDGKLFEIGNLPITILVRPGVSATELPVIMRRWVDRKGIKIIFIDYIGILGMDIKQKQARYEAVGDASIMIQRASRELEIPIVVLAQLNRGVETKPQLINLRESGNLEQDADTVILIHNPKPKDEKPEDEKKRDALIMVAKQRNGMTGDIDCTWRGDRMSFVETDRTRE